MTETIVDDSMLNVTSDSIANNDFSGLNPFEDVDTSKTSSIDKVSLLTDDNDDRLKQSGKLSSLFTIQRQVNSANGSKRKHYYFYIL